MGAARIAAGSLIVGAHAPIVPTFLARNRMGDNTIITGTLFIGSVPYYVGQPEKSLYVYFKTGHNAHIMMLSISFCFPAFVERHVRPN